jgi:P-type Ca2+ transporter type 2C
MIHSAALQTAEAAVTGESLPVSKDIVPISADSVLGDRHNMVFSATAVTYGHGKAVVTATGMHTEIGAIARLLRGAPDEVTPLQKELDHVGKLLGLTVVGIACAMIAMLLLFEDVHGFSAILDVLILGVALAVAAVPEGLPGEFCALVARAQQIHAPFPSSLSCSSRLGAYSNTRCRPACSNAVMRGYVS